MEDDLAVGQVLNPQFGVGERHPHRRAFPDEAEGDPLDPLGQAGLEGEFIRAQGAAQTGEPEDHLLPQMCERCASTFLRLHRLTTATASILCSAYENLDPPHLVTLGCP
jgi:hypothetical protein